MAIKKDTLLIKIEEDGSGKLQATLAGDAAALKATGKAADDAGKGFSNLKGIVAGLAAAGVAKFTVDSILEFERLRASLKTVTGSSEAAAAAMSWIEDFAATTPYDLAQVTGAFIKLKAMGLDPSRAALESYGNTASAMGKDLNSFIEAVADAATGEFERLKEFGIKASSQGEHVAFTFQGVTTKVKKSAGEIEKFLQGIGNNEFAGAMDEQAQTLVGAVSNMQDSFAKLARTIGDAGLTELLDGLARDASQVATNLAAMIKPIEKLSLEELNNERAKAMVLYQQERDNLAVREVQLKRIHELDLLIIEANKKQAAQSEQDKSAANARQLAQAKEEASKAAAKHDAALEKEAEKLKDAVDPMRVLAKEMAKYDEMLSKNYITIGQWTEATVAAIDKAEKGMEDMTESASDNLLELEGAIRGWGDELTDTLVEAATTGKLSFKDMAESILRDIARIVVQQTITKPLVNAVVGAIGTAAMGGPVLAGQRTIVGEHGPEEFIPATDGTIINNRELNGGNVTVQNHISISGAGNVEETRALIYSMLPQITAASTARVFGEMEAGGNAAAMVGRRKF